MGKRLRRVCVRYLIRLCGLSVYVNVAGEVGEVSVQTKLGYGGFVA